MCEANDATLRRLLAACVKSLKRPRRARLRFIALQSRDREGVGFDTGC